METEVRLTSQKGFHIHMERLNEIEERILEIKRIKMERKREIKDMPIALPFIEGRIKQMESEFEDELDLLQTKRQFLIDHQGGARQIREKLTTRLKTEGYFVQANSDDEDIHLMIGLRESNNKGEKVHAIVDGRTGEIRLEEGPRTPHGVLESIESVLTTKDGDKFRVTRSQVGFTTELLPPSENLMAFHSIKDSYPVLEIFNACQEDIVLKKVEIQGKTRNELFARQVTDFAIDTDNLVVDRPRQVRTLKKGERVFGLNPPGATDEGTMKVIVEFQGMASNKGFNKIINVDTPRMGSAT